MKTNTFLLIVGMVTIGIGFTFSSTYAVIAGAAFMAIAIASTLMQGGGKQ